MFVMQKKYSAIYGSFMSFSPVEFQSNVSYSNENGRKICEDNVEIKKRIHEIMAGEIQRTKSRSVI